MKTRRFSLKGFVSALLMQVIFLGAVVAQESNHNEKGEEDGTQFKKSQTYNEVKKGVKLTLKYDASSSSFVGTIENKTKKTVKRARVEVHLSNGTELGPTKPKDLKAGQKITVKLDAKGQVFTTWSTHAEVGSSEHGHGEGGEGGEKGEGHGKEGKGEHGSKSEGRGEHR